MVSRAAKGLQDLGIRKGVKVGLFMPNSAYSVVMYYAILKSGGTVVNYNPAYVERDLGSQVEDSETDMLVTLDIPALLDKAAVILRKTRVRLTVICSARQALNETTRTPGLVQEDGEFTWF